MKRYNPKEIEPKWQEKWSKDDLYSTNLTKSKNKYYVLVELPYSSGDLHMGHWFTFTMGDIIARYKRLKGFNVLLPNGFDAFGLPAENAAIKRGIHPQDWTLSNIARMKEQFSTLGASFDWDKSTISCLPEYYRWNQWIFLKMWEKGLAYRGKTLSSWCSSCQTVLAEENIEAGKCWRCNTEVVQKEIEQWFLKITAYADKLIWQESSSVDWPKPLKESQNNWIGRSEGVLLKFPVKDQDKSDKPTDIMVFTTRPDTIFGATFLILSPEHPYINKLTTSKYQEEVKEYINKAKGKSEQERKENRDKTGVFTGSFAINPFTKKEIPIWVADYVLMGYGTGAIMAVPAHDQRDFDFAKKYGLEIIPVIDSPDGTVIDFMAYEGAGKLINSGIFDGLDSETAYQNITEYIEAHHLGEKKIQYHLHDWSISRQRYWGTPIPFVYCDKCGIVPVPEKDLPVALPYKVDYTPKGKAPLATAEDWVKTKCPKCKGDAERETETMDGFMDNSWYFFRYLDSHNDKEIFNKEIIDQWMPVDIYIGGAEHTYGHALYSRFFTKFFYDLNLCDFQEYALKRIHHGLILGTDGGKMSKSRGNVVNPDEQVKEYGADAIRTYLAFLGPYDIVTPWDPNGLNGTYHFMERVWKLFDKVDLGSSKIKLTSHDLYQMHRTIKKVGEEIEQIKNNTAVAALMEWLNYLSRKDQIHKEEFQNFLILLSSFAPHIAEELWQLVNGTWLIVNGKDNKTINHKPPASDNERTNHKIWSIHQQSWPRYEEKYLEEENITIVIQINGKVRDQMLIQKDLVSKEKDIVDEVLKREKVKKYVGNNPIIKTIFIAGKLINFVVNDKVSKQ